MTDNPNKARYVIMEGYLEYARVFNQNMDSNPEFHPTGQFNVNFYPATQEDADKFFDAGIQPKFRGTPRLKAPKSGEGYGIGKYIKLKRDNVHRIAELGGQPQIVHWSGEEQGKGWSFTEDGELGNGTKALVKVVVYGQGERAGHRLEKVGVIEHVPYEAGADAGSTRF
jgi:hypothetical protein